MYHKNDVKLFTFSTVTSLGNEDVIDESFSDGI